MFVTVSLLLAAACLLPAAGKLLGHPKMRQSAAHFGIPWSGYRLIGIAELAAAAGRRRRPRRGCHRRRAGPGARLLGDRRGRSGALPGT
jgi:DoxX-like family